MLFLARSFSKCPAVLTSNNQALQAYISALVECLNEADPTVRDSATNALAALWKFLGEGRVGPFLAGQLSEQDLQKIKEGDEPADPAEPGGPGATAPENTGAAGTAGCADVDPRAGPPSWGGG